MFHSPLAFLVLAVLIVLALPAVWMLCEVALDVPILGVTIASACAAAVYVLWPHVGLTIADSTLALMALSGGAIALSSLAGGWRWWRAPDPNRLPTARLLRD